MEAVKLAKALPTEQAARALGVSKRTLLRWIKDGKIPEVDRDFRGWRLWRRDDLKRVRAFMGRITPGPVRAQRRLPL